MRKSVKGFVLGLIGGIAGIIVGFYSMVILGLVGAFASEAGTFGVIVTTRVLPWIYLICGGLAIVAGALCFKFARIAGIALLAISGFMSLLPLCLAFFSGIKETSLLIYLVLCLPILFIILAGVSAVKTKFKDAA